jgi:hypothetical protein
MEDGADYPGITPPKPVVLMAKPILQAVKL